MNRDIFRAFARVFEIAKEKRKTKLTRHNGRSGKNGVYNPKHNDRKFDLSKSDHIDPSKENLNVYWDWMQGAHLDQSKTYESFEKVEKKFYALCYRQSVEAKNERNEKLRHPERNKTTDDLLLDKRTCPEESILQIGNIDASVDRATLIKVSYEFFIELNERYGEYLHILDWSLHMEEATPHIHERHVFDCKDAYGFLKPQQEKALELMGIPLPYPDKPKGKTNNRKITFDKICRELFMEICERNALEIDKEPIYGGREYLEKQDYIIKAQRERLQELEAKLAEKTLKIRDIDAIVNEVSDVAYEKACEVVADTVREETVKADIQAVEDYKKWVTAPERKHSNQTKSIISKVLDAVVNKLKKSSKEMLKKITASLQNKDVREQNLEEIRTVARESILSQLRRMKEEADERKGPAKPAVKKEQLIH